MSRRVNVVAALILLAVGCDDLAGDSGGGDHCPDPTDPCVHYESRDPEECNTLDFTCDADQTGFGGECGCGCLDACGRR